MFQVRLGSRSFVHFVRACPLLLLSVVWLLEAYNVLVFSHFLVIRDSIIRLGRELRKFLRCVVTTNKYAPTHVYGAWQELQ